uniref:Putative secreted protein n=1 Tax=Anopheles triannulatus TaxID=58253 RepID=A0A2M4B5X7_9DIPT
MSRALLILRLASVQHHILCAVILITNPSMERYTRFSLLARQTSRFVLFELELQVARQLSVSLLLKSDICVIRTLATV